MEIRGYLEHSPDKSNEAGMNFLKKDE